MTGIAEAAKSRTPLLVLAADTGAGRRPVELPDRPGRAGQCRGRGGRAGAHARVGRAPTSSAPTGRRWSSGAPSCSTCPWTCRPPPPRTARCRRCPRWRRSGRTPGPSPSWPRWSRPRSARCSSPAGVRAAAGRELRALGTACGALLATSAVAHGLFAGDPWALGISGGFASPLAAELIRDADLVVGWGCALNMWTTRHGTLIGPGPGWCRSTSTPTRSARTGPSTSGVLGDVAATATDLLAAVTPRTGYRTDAVRAAIAQRVRWRDVPYDDLTGAGGHRPAHAVDRAGRRAARASGPSRSTPATSWATRAPTWRSRTRPASASRRRSSRSGWGWPRRSARRGPGRTGWRSPRSATAAR